MNSIKKTLLDIGAITNANIELTPYKTRDNKDIEVMIDKKTGVIFIDDHYVGNQEYELGQYGAPLQASIGALGYEDRANTDRRLSKYQQFIADREICDFGCGAGSFLKQARLSALSVSGIELQDSYIAELIAQNIECHRELEALNTLKDSFFLFHCLEHLQNPLEILIKIYGCLKSNGHGSVIVEVPHAEDFLLSHLKHLPFIEFTLWSQHLVLHTRKSLELLLTAAGFKNIIIEGIQRFSISNHLNWLVNNTPGGHKKTISALETEDLRVAYGHALSRINANDTLVAIAST